MRIQRENACKWMSRHVHSGKESLILLVLKFLDKTDPSKQNRGGEMGY